MVHLFQCLEADMHVLMNTSMTLLYRLLCRVIARTAQDGMLTLSTACCRANVRQIIFAARFGAHLGNYMMHCHNIVHEDKDMLRAFLSWCGAICFLLPGLHVHHCSPRFYLSYVALSSEHQQHVAYVLDCGPFESSSQCQPGADATRACCRSSTQHKA